MKRRDLPTSIESCSDWIEVGIEPPEPNRTLWLYGIDSNNQCDRFDVGRNDPVYGLISDHGPSMTTTHYQYCKAPEVYNRKCGLNAND